MIKRQESKCPYVLMCLEEKCPNLYGLCCIYQFHQSNERAIRETHERPKSLDVNVGGLRK